MGAYFGQAIPEDLQLRVRKHVELVAKLKPIAINSASSPHG